jgi:hypothetical protein
MTQKEAIGLAKELISTRFPDLIGRRITFVFSPDKGSDFYMAVKWVVIAY